MHLTPYLFNGSYYDEARKLLNLGERWYSTQEQNLLTPDPILVEQPMESVGRPAMLQPYTYAQSNPLRFRDTDGWATSGVRAAFASPLKLVRGQTRALAGPLMDPKVAAKDRQIAIAKTRANARKGIGGPAALVRLATSDRGQKLQAFSDRFEAKPLLKINLQGGPDGWKLQDIRLKPFFSAIPKLKKQWDFDGYQTKQSATGAVAGGALSTNGAASNTGATSQSSSAQASVAPTSSTQASANGTAAKGTLTGFENTKVTDILARLKAQIAKQAANTATSNPSTAAKSN